MILSVVANALLQSLWQGARVGGGCAVLLGLLPAARPRLRHGVAMLGLLAQVGLFALSLVLGTCGALLQPVLLSSSRVLLAVGRPDWVAWVVWLWGGGVLLMALRLLRGWHLSRRLRTQAAPVSPDLAARVALLAQRVGLPSVTAALQNADEGTQVVGLLRPVLLIPAATLVGLTPQQLDAVLVHELAHLAHHDPIALAVQEAVTVLFFFHPVTWWLGSVARTAREYACDDVAARIVGRKALAGALFALESHRVAVLALAASGAL